VRRMRCDVLDDRSWSPLDCWGLSHRTSWNVRESSATDESIEEFWINEAGRTKLNLRLGNFGNMTSSSGLPSVKTILHLLYLTLECDQTKMEDSIAIGTRNYYTQDCDFSFCLLSESVRNTHAITLSLRKG
jgi:hypothetical protein